MKLYTKILLGLAVVPMALIGCKSESSMPKEEYADKSAMTSVASKAFNQKREWAALSADEKAPFLKFYKDEAKAKEAFDKIVSGLKYFSGGGTPQAGPPPQGN